jgi:hypothetical protein
MSKTNLRRMLVTGCSVAVLAAQAAPASAMNGGGGPGSSQAATITMNGGGGPG